MELTDLEQLRMQNITLEAGLIQKNIEMLQAQIRFLSHLTQDKNVELRQMQQEILKGKELDPKQYCIVWESDKFTLQAKPANSDERNSKRDKSQ
jgi:hypothetical protein